MQIRNKPVCCGWLWRQLMDSSFLDFLDDLDDLVKYLYISIFTFSLRRMIKLHLKNFVVPSNWYDKLPKLPVCFIIPPFHIYENQILKIFNLFYTLFDMVFLLFLYFHTIIQILYGKTIQKKYLHASAYISDYTSKFCSLRY